MPGNRRRWQLDLARTPDDIVVLFAREAGLAAALAELRARCRRWIDAWRGPLAHAAGVNAADRDDARQQALFWAQSAIADFDIEQLVKPKGCSFRTFLEKRIRSRFANFVRGLRRHSRRYRALPDADSLVARPDSGDSQELLKRVEQVVERLDDSKRALWAGLCANKTHAEIAKEMGVSTKTIQRRWQELVARLRREVRPDEIDDLDT